MVQEISRDQIKQNLDAGTPMVLLEALPENYYTESHLPGAIQMLPEDMEANAATALPDKEALIVTYCANQECSNSVTAAEKLTELGYTNVQEYAAGKADWSEAGLPTESKMSGGGCGSHSCGCA